MILGKGYIPYDLFSTCAATVAMARFLKKDHKKAADHLATVYSQSYLDKSLKKDFLKAGDALYKRAKKLKYENDKERAMVLNQFSDSISEKGKKKFFGGTYFNKLDSPAKNKSKEAVKGFEQWLKDSVVQSIISKAFG